MQPHRAHWRYARRGAAGHGVTDTTAFDEAVDAADDDDIAAVLTLASHPDSEVRRLVAMTLPLLTHGDAPTEAMVAAVVALSSDRDARVRDGACFVLAQQWREVDTPELREALAARLDDGDPSVSSEALVGLAYRSDPRALPRVRKALLGPRGTPERLALVAAGALSAPQLHDLVLEHQDAWSAANDPQTAEAVRRLTDPAGPGADLLDGVTELYRRRAHGRPDGDALSAWRLMDEMLDMAPHRAPEFFAGVLARADGDPTTEIELRERSALAQIAGLAGGDGQ